MVEYSEMLWMFSQLPDDYVAIDTETTGLRDEDGQPDVVTFGLTIIRDKKIFESYEFETRPSRAITKEAEAVHGITNERAAEFATFESQWEKIYRCLANQLIVIHNASFDWPIILEHVERYNLTMPPIRGVFCSQKAAIPWAQASELECGRRGPSLDTLTAEFKVENFRAKVGGMHGAEIDSRQLALVVEAIRVKTEAL